MATERNPAETREWLRRVFGSDPEARLFTNIIRVLADPVKPRGDRGRFRPHPLLVWFLGIGLVACGVFAYFSYGQP